MAEKPTAGAGPAGRNPGEDREDKDERREGAAGRAKRGVKRAARLVKEVTYPHSIHPALVPGVAIEDQKVRYRIDRPILFVVGALIVAFVAWGIADPDQVLVYSTAALQWTMENLGWIFTLLAIVLVVVLIVIAASHYGRIPLGLDGEKPQYSTLSWAAMLFAAGIGIGLIFFGPVEPLTHYLEPRPGAYDPATWEAVRGGIAQAALHWGINAWAIYALVGLAVAYASYRRGRVPLMSSILAPLLGTNRSDHWAARLIDGLAIIATLFGTAASLGLGALQIGRGAELVTGWSTAGNTAAIVIVVVLTIGTIVSAVSGVAKGIRRLSNINLVLSVGLAVFFFVVGPTAFLINMIPGAIMEYVGELPQMLAANMADSEEMAEFLSGWTTFYWAWWVSWAPFVGVFVAKISRGRTIRQFVAGVLLIPSTIIVLAFTVLGGTAIWLQRETGELVPNNDMANMPPAEDMFFEVLSYLPGAGVIAPLIMVVLAIFFITTADSASLVNSQLSQGGAPNPNKWVTAFWALCMAGIAVVMLLTGGENSLQGLQNLITVTALPFAVIFVFMTIALVKELRSDPASIRHSHRREALDGAVQRGIRDFGDRWMLSVEEAAEPDESYAAGEEFDSTDDAALDWYARTDEQGRRVGYDYEEGRYLDEVNDGPQRADPHSARERMRAESEKRREEGDS